MACSSRHHAVLHDVLSGLYIPSIQVLLDIMSKGTVLPELKCMSGKLS